MEEKLMITMWILTKLAENGILKATEELGAKSMVTAQEAEAAG